MLSLSVLPPLPGSSLASGVSRNPGPGGGSSASGGGAFSGAISASRRTGGKYVSMTSGGPSY